jgi:hypothetical protein
MMLELVRGVRDPILWERLLQVKNPTIDDLIGIANSWPLTLGGLGVLDTGGACAQQEVVKYQQARPQAEVTGSQWGGECIRGRCRAGETEVTIAKDAQDGNVRTGNAGAEITARREPPDTDGGSDKNNGGGIPNRRAASRSESYHKEDNGGPLGFVTDKRRKPPNMSFRILAPNKQGRRRNRQKRQMTFFTNFWRFRGNYV